MKKLFIIGVFALFVYACGNEKKETTDDAAPVEDAQKKADPSYDTNRGEGKFKDVKLADKLDNAMALRGEKIADLKCLSCHKLTDEKLVGPGWKGATTRHKPEWIMNFVTNTDVMIDKDPKAQAMLEICMVRMPNQNLDDAAARDVLEFLRKNDGVK
ncbi:cytochrome c [Pedobacter changchengzhani]|uniref:Cytochrome c n=1 Tax=Pedobacter changchengzhani TaxID=2529274 RepID=A0A4R5MNM0_9SPHI|nr:c-type cytochrome [Pedobacter changchengzhani]TDG37420.1 cytochrome c [Pedobacter changchengzhani]